MPVMAWFDATKMPSFAATGGVSSLYHAPVTVPRSGGFVHVTVKFATLVQTDGVTVRFCGAPGALLSRVKGASLGSTVT